MEYNKDEKYLSRYHAKWVDNFTYSFELDTAICSGCKRRSFFIRPTKYCPHCRRRMNLDLLTRQ